MNEKLHQNRIVIVGRNPRDAYDHSRQLETPDNLESPYLVNAASHRLTILGGLAGMHVGTVHVTATAPEGENYEVVLEAIGYLKERNPALKIVEETRTVEA